MIKYEELLITQQGLKKILEYNPLTGNFIWIKKISKKNNIGDIAGCLCNTNNCIVIGINNILYLAHRLAFLYMEGKWPENEVDHKDHIRSNNKWKNLRKVTHLENGKNVSLHINNTSGYVGVGWFKRDCKWMVTIKVNQKSIYLGLFKNKEKAIKVRKDAEKKYRFHENHGKRKRVELI